VGPFSITDADMNVSPSKENILKKIRQALIHSTPLPFPKSEGNQPGYPPLEREAKGDVPEQCTKRLRRKAK